MNILLLGATGYAGSLLLRLLLSHPHVSTLDAYSSSKSGSPILEPNLPNSHKMNMPHYIGIDDLHSSYDAIFSALPHGVSLDMYQKLEKTSISDSVYIDLSADFRFRDVDSYLQIYAEFTKQTKSIALTRAFAKSVYGLSELQRQYIANFDIIACPGCYPTAILLPLIPIVKYCSPRATITCNAISGISGAGSSPSATTMYCNRNESLKPYAPGRTHRHFSEIAYQLNEFASSEVDFTFTPHLAPLSQGMLATISVPLEAKDVARASKALRAQYIDEPFITVLDAEATNTIDTKLVRNTNTMLIALHQEEDCLLVFSAIDNLWKGAAGQAIQNFNIRFGLDERAGLQFFAT